MANGVTLLLSSAFMFALLYYYPVWLSPLDAEQIFGWRMLLTLPGVSLYLWLSGEWRLVVSLFNEVKRRPLLWVGLPLSALLVGVQLWIFMWAPVNGRGLPVSLGYFMMPLVMVVLGRFVYKEQLSFLRILAVVAALVGVANQVWQTGGVSWETFVVALGYPFYFLLRRWQGNDHLGGIWCDMFLLLPVAVWFALIEGDAVAFSDNESLWWLVIGLGLISALALIFYLLSAKLLTFSLFGLLSYLEPVLLVFVSLLLGESIAEHEWLTYIAIWAAVGLLVIEGAQKVWRSRRYPVSDQA
ncbi:EamA family transporter RarD [Oceanospirillum linum]|uniref:Chemotaxis protein n=1 Tax=Oceanospirillum linum TaxID=966 RepID=A0A1T1HE11_OCELI|nr:EamA family transporter RarD [Oceanospirillum linum]OOV88089.1 chemotaxis protein [Oceanospirillum linum]SEF42755.1 chloramphenicol-sensitive protein RarD [Oleiphilus messinensis]SMP01142.1 chloramphenicol-sensitive protein RarD [Oceanospirillum linum]